MQGAAIALHGPLHRERGRAARVIVHTHQPWTSALACVHGPSLTRFPRALREHIGVDDDYTGNWPIGSRRGAMAEGERLLSVRALRNKTVGLLANHGLLVVAERVERALVYTLWMETFARQQARSDDATAALSASARPPRLLSRDDAEFGTRGAARARHGTSDCAQVRQAGRRHLERHRPDARGARRVHAAPSDARGRRRVARALRDGGHLPTDLAPQRIRHLRGLLSHFSVRDADGARFVAPAAVPFFAMTASDIVRCDDALQCDDEVYGALLRLFDAARTDVYPVVLGVHTRHVPERLRFVHQSALNFASDAYVERRAAKDWHDAFPLDDAHVFVLTQHGCIVRGATVAHAYALLHSFDAAPKCSKSPRCTSDPCASSIGARRAVPEHGYGDLRNGSKRADLNFWANVRMLAADWNHGLRDTGDASFLT